MAFSLLQIGFVLILSFAETATNPVRQRLLELGYGETVAQAIADRRPDLHAGILLEQREGVPPPQSAYRPVRLYRGTEALLESYDAATGRGSVMSRDGGRWMTSLIETAQFYAGLTGLQRPGNPEVLNRGIVLQLEVPAILIEPGGSNLALLVKLEKMPDESVFTSRVALGRYLVEPDAGNPAQLSHAKVASVKAPPPLLTWFNAEEILKGGRVSLPTWVDPACHSMLQTLIHPLPGLNPHF